LEDEITVLLTKQAGRLNEQGSPSTWTKDLKAWSFCQYLELAVETGCAFAWRMHLSFDRCQSQKDALATLEQKMARE